MTSKEALINLKLDVSCRGKLSKFQQHCFDLLEKEFETTTFDECIKKWEEKGWTVSELKQFPVIKIWKLNQKQGFVDNIYIFNKTLTSKIDFDADYETLNLLTKTLKALEETKNDNNR